MLYDENGNPIDEEGNILQNESDNSELETSEASGAIETGGDFVDDLISGLLTEEEKANLKPAKESGKKPDEATTEETGQTKQAPEKTEVKTEKGDEWKGKTFNVDGQEITYDELTGGYLRQSDYTKKTQQLADERQKMERFKVLNEYLERNPQEFQRVIDLFKGGQQQQPQRPEDPIDAIAYDATQSAINAVQGPLQGVSSEISELRKQQRINQVQTAISVDPLKDKVIGAMKEHCFGEYAAIHGEDEGKKLFEKFDTDPDLFVRNYVRVRGLVEKKEAAGKKTTPVAVEKKTPFVADSTQGNGTPVNKEKLKRKELNHLRQKTRGGKTEDVVRFLEASGMVDHLS